MSLTRSPIIMAGALVLPETICGMIEQSATRSPRHALDAQALVHNCHSVAVRAHFASSGWMVDGGGRVARPVEQCRHSHHRQCRARGMFFGDHICHRVRCVQCACNPDALDNGILIKLRRKIVRVDLGMHRSDVAGFQHQSPALSGRSCRTDAVKAVKLMRRRRQVCPR